MPEEASRHRLLVVDDEPQILRALRTTLGAGGYEVATATSGAEALAAAAACTPDAVVLDLVLPDRSGIDVCRELRSRSSVPIVVLSALDDEATKVIALGAGADDFVTKPFGVDELLARLRALIRRSSAVREPILHVGDVTVDLEKRAVLVRGTLVELTPTEFALLSLFARNEGKLLAHATIMRAVWGDGSRDASDHLHVYVSRLRRKIELDPMRPRHVLTEPRAGYRMVAPGSAE